MNDNGFKFWVMIYQDKSIVYSGINFTGSRLKVIGNVYKNKDLPVIYMQKYNLEVKGVEQ